ncbi:MULTISPECIES: DUF4376 domain-containing protein [unclassified Pseudomonas]|uniref:DUF4376 domain-containing protein n=1 Tax=unclassified Pseudomonas TaxID=196821 RepID=UPI00119B9109|nr:MULTISPECIES: DUF4376 domain-containing protein [unclassified Pseudomonas]TWC15224.1 uncharacterized protein DUF4376 [Pseudomonas sp. SJZ075]TWC19284.1 uncharacterized protein DUF4376 [Pseudomonas sp. SJZ074]TWC31484.1 uncharacterized protein DUF4376 [Pseudomonas sp. SJZ078]TWC37090.1 uncharacterized protein DUF4376 [Pseudomonas sp. SJZ085]TWC52220.1 uncharacterized protein DUF4376 [Pseudomonas sp. SJZ124]
MPYVQRNDIGEIIGRFANVQPGNAEEWVELEDIPVDWVALIAAARFDYEVAGTLINGMSISTDRTTQNKLFGAALRAGRNADYVIDWKLSDGSFVTLTSAAILALADGVCDYVQACYAREAALLIALNNGSFTEAMLEEGWPV